MSKKLSIGALPIISANERLAAPKFITGCIFGAYGVGKTSLLWSLDSDSTLFIDLEAGDLSVEGWRGDTIRPTSWPECRDLACYIGLWNKAISNDRPYSEAHFNAVISKFGCLEEFNNKYQTIFIDSITVAARMCLQWCKSQPQAFSEKTGKQDMRAVYGLHGQEMINWLTHLQQSRAFNIWFVGILEEKEDDLGRRYFAPQIDGSKTPNELPGIVDQVITMAEFKGGGSGDNYRAFINHTSNPYGYPAKDRSGRLEMIEPAHLGQLMEKIKSPITDDDRQFSYKIPNKQNNNK